MRAVSAACLVMLVGLSPQPALAQTSSDEPILRPNLAMHTAPVGDVSADSACTQMATGSDDKTVKLWSLPSGALIRTLRPPIGREAQSGRVFAVALSPDGRFVAAGGREQAVAPGQHSVWLFDAQTGDIVRHFDGFEGAILALRFSPDGARLAVGLQGGGARVLDMGSGAEAIVDRAAGDVYGVAFLPGGRLIATSFDGRVRLYDQAGVKTAEIEPRAGQRPKSVAADPAGGQIAVGYDAFPAIDLFDARLQPLGTVEVPGARSDFRLAFSGDGRLGAAGVVADASGARPAVVGIRFEGGGPGAQVTTPVGEVGFWNLAPCGVDGFAFAMSDPRVGLVRDGKVALDLAPSLPDMVGKRLFADRERATVVLGPAVEGLTASGDLKRLRFGLKRGAADPVEIDLRTRALSRVPDTVAPGLKGADTTALKVTDWVNMPSFRLRGDLKPLPDGLVAHSLSIDRAGRGFMLGVNAGLLGMTAAGEIFSKAVTPGPAYGVLLSDDARLLVAALGDGTLRWHRTSDGVELLALLVDRESLDWVAFTPSGYYAASPGGDRLIGWHVNRGPDEAADFFPAGHFRDRFYRPDVVERVLDAADEAAAIKAADAARGAQPAVPAAPVAVADLLPPVVTLLSPAQVVLEGSQPLTIRFRVGPSGKDAATAIEALIDGRPAFGTRGLQRVDAAAPAPAASGGPCLPVTGAGGLVRSGPSEGDPGLPAPDTGRAADPEAGCTVTLDVPAGARTVSLVAYRGDRVSEPATVALSRAAPPPVASAVATPEPAAPGGDAVTAKPRLFALVVGVSLYDAAEIRLDWAAQDARDLAAAMKAQEGGLYETVTVRLLADDDASAAAIREGLDWIVGEVSPKDVGLVFFAGHGVDDAARRYFFLPVGADPANIEATSVSGEEINAKVRSLAGKALYLVDTCHSGDALRDKRTDKGAGEGRAFAGFREGFRRRIMLAASPGVPEGDGDVAGLGTPGPVDVTAIVNEMASAENGVVMFSSSTGTQVSQEQAEWENGAFTEALLEGLSGKADYNGDKALSIAELDLFVSDRVKALTERQQQPVVRKPDTIPDFAIAIVR